MSVISSAGANYTSQLTRFPPIAGSVGNIYTPNLINNTNVGSGISATIVSSALVEGTYIIQGFLEVTCNTADETLDTVAVDIQASNADGVLQTIITFSAIIPQDNLFYIPINWSLYAITTATPNFVISIDGTTSAGTYDVASGTLNITKIA